MKGRGNIIGLFGLWLIVAGVWRFGMYGEIWSNVISGVIVALLGFSLAGRARGNGWISGIFGLWMIVSVFVPGLQTGAGLLINNIISGAVLAIAGFSMPSGPTAAEPRLRRAA